MLSLEKTSEGLTLHCPPFNPFQVNFTEPAFLHRLRSSTWRTPLIRALGLKKHPNATILDCGAGWGFDGLLLAQFCQHITLLEQCPTVHALLADALERASQHPSLQPLVQRITLHATNALEYLRALPDQQRPDMIYLDPMFPPRQKSALVKRKMQILQQIAPYSPQETATLYDTACQLANHRVVCKRPRSTPALGKPDFTITQTLVHFDVTLQKNDH